MAGILKINPDSDNRVRHCPHCQKPIEELHYFTAIWPLTVNYVFACPHCLKVRGISTG